MSASITPAGRITTGPAGRDRPDRRRNHARRYRVFAAIALVRTMMFHPQLGVLNYLLSLVGLPPSAWVYDSGTVIPTLVMV